MCVHATSFLNYSDCHGQCTIFNTDFSHGFSSHNDELLKIGSLKIIDSMNEQADLLLEAIKNVNMIGRIVYRLFQF